MTDPTNKTDSSGRFVPPPPFNLLIFGATGDLARRKLIPALYNRWCDGQISESVRIVGISRTDMTREDWGKMAEEAVKDAAETKQVDATSLANFCKILDYATLDVLDTETDWAFLHDRLDPSHSVTVMYLATSPSLFVAIAGQLGAIGLNKPGCRLVLEKPIGRDLTSAKEINAGVCAHFEESQIFRIDHYLGKETVQNLMVLRFANVFFEPLWNRSSIDHVQITVGEEIGLEGRAGYYDRSGALRDMVQNHLLQLMCLVAMEPPASNDGLDVRTEKIKVLRALLASGKTPKTVRGQYSGGVVRGQSVRSYREELGEDDDSSTETFVTLRAEIDNWRWAGVPFYLRTGKRMSFRRSEIVIAFKPVPHPLFEGSSEHANHLVLRLQPDESVKLFMHMKEPGAGGVRVRYLPLDLSYAETFAVQYPDAYERLLMEVVRGNLSLFMSRDEVESAWQWIDRILHEWDESSDLPDLYRAGEDGPSASNKLIETDGRKWWSEDD